MIGLNTSQPRLALAILGLSYACASTSIARTIDLSALQQASATSQFDGAYTGNSQLAGTNITACRPAQKVTLNVRNGQFQLPWNEPLMFNARISPDGAFFATTSGTMIQAEKHMTLLPTLQGHVGGASLVADYGTRWCRYRLDAARS